MLRDRDTRPAAHQAPRDATLCRVRAGSGGASSGYLFRVSPPPTERVAGCGAREAGGAPRLPACSVAPIVHSVMALLGGALDWLLSLPGSLAVLAIFLLPALEASAFVGVVVPGEAAIVIGGALAAQGRISLASAIAAAVLGAIVGDTIGYAVGKRWGRKMVPRLSPRRARRLASAEEFLRRHPGWAITMGRFPPGLRTFIPGAAGMARVRYPSFLFYNVLGAAIWGTSFVLAGYEAGRNWRRVETLVTGGGFALLAAIVLGWLLVRSYRRGALAGLRKVRRPRPS